MTAWIAKDAGVLHQDFDGESVIIDLDSGNYFSLTGSAGTLWHHLTSGARTLDTLCAALTAMHDVSADMVRSDVTAFLADLEREGLVRRRAGVEAEAWVPAVDGAGTPYLPPHVETYRDLEDLFLLDPVHDVDPAAGWPHTDPSATGDPATANPPEDHAASGPSAASARGPVRLAPADLIWASAGETTVVVNRDRGLFCRLDGAAAAAWCAMTGGAIQMGDPGLASALLDGGFVEPTNEPARPDADVPVGGGYRVHAELVEQIRPWGERRRPARLPAGPSVRGLGDRLDAWFATSVPAPTRSEHRIARHLICVETGAGDPCAVLSHALPAVGPGGSDRPSGPGLHILAWQGSVDDASPMLATLVDSLRANWTTLCGPRGEVVDLHTDVTSAIFDPGTGLLSVVDRSRARAWAVKVDDRPLPFWELGSPFRFILHDHFAHHAMQFVHGAAVGDGTNALLIVGMGGSGKSSTALACAAAGMRYLGDDYCLVEVGTREVHSLYRSGKLVGPDDLVRLPSFAGHSTNADSFERGGTGKGVYLVDAVVPGCHEATGRMVGLAVPRVVAATESSVARGLEGDALEALVPSTIGQLPGADRDDARRLEQLITAVPAMRLALGSDPGGVAAAVRDALAACAAST